MAPQGLKGELRVNPSSDFPERFLEPGTRWLQRKGSLAPVPVELQGGYQIPGKNLYVVQLEGIETREEADNLRGCKLLVPAKDRPQLEEGEYHVGDLINLEVYHQLTGDKIGVVIDVYFAGNDLLKVQLHQKPAPILIPFVTEIVPVVDLEKGRLEINPPAGLLELNV